MEVVREQFEFTFSFEFVPVRFKGIEKDFEFSFPLSRMNSRSCFNSKFAFRSVSEKYGSFCAGVEINPEPQKRSFFR